MIDAGCSLTFVVARLKPNTSVWRDGFTTTHVNDANREVLLNAVMVSVDIKLIVKLQPLVSENAKLAYIK